MDRRSFLKSSLSVGALAASGGIAAPAIAQGAAKTLKFVPQANLANFDPIWGTQYVVRNASVLVWDTLYGVDSKLEPQRQMVEGEEVSSDGLTWTFKLRSGLKFHDGEPVLAKDVVASLARWAVRDSDGPDDPGHPEGAGRGRRQDREMGAVEALPEDEIRARQEQHADRLHHAGAHRQDRSLQADHRVHRQRPDDVRAPTSGCPARRPYSRSSPAIVPRQEPASWLAGGKNIAIDRLEWIIMPDPATASAALQNGEIDWWETPIPDLVPILKRNRNIKVDIADPLGNVGSFRLNHMHPPFDNVKVRRAVQMALSQEDYMRAVVGSDDSLWQAAAELLHARHAATTPTPAATLSRARATSMPPRSCWRRPAIPASP